MLSYAFQVLKEQGYRDIATEQFHNVAELCSEILIKGVTIQLKRGLGKEYISQTEPLTSPRGKIDVTESVKSQSLLRKQLVCTYDEFTVNSYLNRILKTTMAMLLRADIDKSRKKRLRQILIYFKDVDTLDAHQINWNVQFNRNNQSYRMLISMCYLVVKGLLQSQSSGSLHLMDFIDEQRMHRLYERFILEYYKQEHPELQVSAPHIRWQLDDGFDFMLPDMKTDIVLSNANHTLIIDAKYYSHTTQSQFDTHTVHSGNLYQIFTYVKNKSLEYENTPHAVSGMLLYAKTDEEIQPNQVYHMSGNQISVSTLDLNLPFPEIRSQLDKIAADHFGQ